MRSYEDEHALTVILTDFDHTLFDATAFKEVLKRTVCSILGLSSDIYDEVYWQLRTELQRGFSVALFETVLAQNGRQLSSHESEVLQTAVQMICEDTTMYLYDDVPQFLRLAQTWQARPVIVSFGDPIFQHLKLHGTGIEIFLPDVRFVEQPGDIKDDMIEAAVAEYPDARFVYLEDRGDLIDRAKTYYPKMVAIQMSRPGAKYEHMPSALADHVVTSFQPLPRLLASCLSCARGDDHRGHTHV